MSEKAQYTVDIPEEYSQVAVCDLEGTLTKSADLLWTKLSEAHGVQEKESIELYNKFRKDDTYTQEKYREDIIKAWNNGDRRPTQERIERLMEDHFELHPVAFDFIETLQEAGYYTLIVSGAPDTYSSMAVEEFDMNGTGRDVRTIRMVYDDDGALERFDWTQYKSNKAALVEDIRQQEHVENILAVGNAGNDKGMVAVADQAFMVDSADLPYGELEAKHDHLTVGGLDEHVAILRNGGGSQGEPDG